MSDVKKLYNALLSHGYTSDDLGDENTFSSAMGDANNRKELYDGAKANGLDLGDYDEYERRLTQTSNNTIQATTPEPPKAEEVKPIQVPSAPTLKYGEVEDKEYLTPAETTRKMMAQGVKQRQQVADMTANVQQALDDRGVELDAQARQSSQSFIPRGTAGSVAGYDAGRMYDSEYRDYAAAKEALDNAQKLMDEAVANGKEENNKGLFNGFFKSAKRGAEDLDLNNFTFGLKDASENEALLKALDAADEGNATPSQQALLDAAALQMATQADYGSMVGRGYKAGQVTGQAIPFMVEIAINPLSKAGKSVANRVARHYIKKYLINEVLEQAAKKGTKYALTRIAPRAAQVVGDIAGAAGMAATTGAANVTADAFKRMQGDVLYSTAEDGTVKYDGHTEGDDAATAFAKAYANSTLQNYSEMFGGYFAPLSRAAGKGITKGLSKVGLDKINSLLNEVSASDLARVVTDFEQYANWNGTMGEFAEEITGGVLNSIFVGDQTLGEVFDKENLTQTLVDVAFLGGIMSSAKVIDYPAYKYQAQSDIKKAKIPFDKLFGSEDKAVMETAFNDSDARVAGNKLREIINSDDYTEEQKMAAANYAKTIQAYKGAKLMDDKRFADPYIPQEEKNVEEAYDKGRAAETPAEMTDANNMYEIALAEIRDYYQMGEDTTEDDIKTLLGGNLLKAAFDVRESEPALSNIILKLAYATATRDGIIDAARDRISEESAQAEAIIDYRKNKTDGMIHPATLKTKDANGNDRQVYIVSGNIATFEDGTINTQESDNDIIIQDAVTGKPEFATAKDLLRAEQAIDPEVEKQNVRNTIADTIATEVENKMNNVLPFNVGDAYNVIGADGAEHSVQVIADNGDGSVMVSIDNAEAMAMPKSEIQQLSNEYNMNRARLANEAQKEAKQSEKMMQEAQNVEPTNVVEQTTETPAEVVPERVVPTLKDGNPDFNAMDAEMFVDEYVSRYGEDSAVKIARKNISNARENIAKIDKKIDDITDPNQMEGLYVQRKSAEAQIARYSDILDRLGASEDANETEADQRNRLRNDAGNRIATLFPDGMPNVESVILADIATGNRIRWSDKTTNGAVTSRGLGAELGYTEAERRKRLPLIGKDAMTPEEYAESLRERLDALGVRYDESSLRDAVLSVYQSVDSRKGAWDALENISRRAQEPEMDADWEDMQAQMARNKVQGDNTPALPDMPDLASIEEETPISENENAEMEAQAQEGEQSDYDAMMDEFEGEFRPKYMNLSKEEVDIVLDAMKIGAEIEPAAIELTPENWTSEFGDNGILSTPIGDVKMGEGQYLKLMQRKREKYFGLIKPTLNNPDVVLEEYDPKDGAERDTKLLFVKTFAKEDGRRYVHFESVTVQKESKEISISSHEVNESDLKKKMHNNNVVHLKDSFFDSEGRLIEPQNEGSDLVPTPNVSSESKDTTSEPKSQEVDEKILQEEQKVNVNPTDGQKEAGNYKKGHVVVDGFNITIEQPKGSVRSGVDADGKEWSITMNNTYGYIRGTEGVDGDHIDVFLSDNLDNWGGEVFVVDQINTDGSFDEHKVMYGFNSIEEAQQAYLSNYSEGWQGLGAITGISKDEFKKWIASSHRKTKPFAEYKSVKTTEGQAVNTTDSASLAEDEQILFRNVYHGSGAEFDKFDHSFIGTGEGNQAFGWGTYVTEVEGIGKRYADIHPLFYNKRLELSKLRREQIKLSENIPFLKGKALKKATQELEKIKKALTSLSNEANRYLYSVEIPDDNGNNYIYWDREVSEDAIKDLQKKLNLPDTYFVSNYPMTGERVYKALSELLGGDKVASKALNNSGYVGISYPADNGNAGDARNYVIFNEADLDISDSVRFRSAEPAPVFYSNAEYAVKAVKQEKATPEQWLKMIEKNGGLKAGEDKWLGLSDWLTSSDKKTLTKQEVLDFIKENQIQIEEVEYAENPQGFEELKKEYDGWLRDGGYDYAWDKLIERYGYDSTVAFDDVGGELVVQYGNTASKLLGGEVSTINKTRLDYTTEGLENNKEIALVVPTIESWNESDEIHFGDAGNGRAIAWVRFGETTDADGNRVLVIDEVQSKRHQDGREKGYRPSNIKQYLKDNGVEVIETGEFYEFHKNGELDKRFSKGLLHNDINRAKQMYVGGYVKSDIPSAPFEKNWAELAMKRILRYAAENGFDKVAWTTGEQQADRYDLSKSVDVINAEHNEDGSYNINVATVDDSHFIQENNIPESRLTELVGKEMALSIVKATQESEDGKAEIEGNNLRIGGSGMKAFYDQMIPSFMNKYGKKWGVKVGEVTMPSLEENNTMHSIDVTDAMRESVMQGQPMFRLSDKEQTKLAGWYDNIAERYNVSGNIQVAPSREVFEQTLRDNGVAEDKLAEYDKAAYIPEKDMYLINGDSIKDNIEAERAIFHEVWHKLRKDIITLSELEWLAKSIGSNRLQALNDAFWNGKYETDEAIVDELISVSIEPYIEATVDVDGKPVSAFEAYLDNHITLNEATDAAKANMTEAANEFSDVFDKIFFETKRTLIAYKNQYYGKAQNRVPKRGEQKRTQPSTKQVLEDRPVQTAGVRGDADIKATRATRAEQRQKAIISTATDLASSLGVKMTIIEDLNEINDSNPKMRKSKRGSKAWYNIPTDEVVFVAPNATSVFDAMQSVWHEVVAHKGLRDVVGREKFDAFLMKVFNAADVNTRSKIVALAAKNGWDLNLATEEYLASLAEEGFDSRENRTFWQKVRDFFMDMLREAKIVIGYNITDNDMRYMLWRTYQKQKSQGAMAVAEDVLMQQKLGVGNFRTRPAGTRQMTEEEQIIADAKANGTYLKAPNGKKSNLTPKQWVQVRTKAFKEWFGDWEKAARIEKLRKSKDAEITGNEIEASEDLKQYKKNAQMYGRTLQGEYTNTDTGAVISLQRGRHNGGINEVLQHNYKDVAHLQSVAAIPQIIENGIYIESQPNKDTDTNPDVKEYQMFVCGLKIGGEDYTVLAKVAVDSKGNRYYDHNLVSVEKGKLIDIANNEQSAISSGFGTTPDTKSTTNSQRKYKELVSILQTNSSKIVDANGEPKVVEHSTWNDDFYTFDIEHLGESSGDEGVYGAGFYFGNIGDTKIYGDRAIQAYLNMRNPIVLPDAPIRGFFDYLVKNFDKEGLRDIVIKGDNKTATIGDVVDAIKEVNKAHVRGEYADLIEQMSQYWYPADEMVLEQQIFRKIGFAIYGTLQPFIEYNVGRKEFSEALRNAGYDGVVYDSTEYVAFNPNQIKSATDNVGTFDANNDDIRFRTTKSADIEDGEVKGVREAFDKKVRSAWYQTKEAMYDNRQALKEYMRLATKAHGANLPNDDMKHIEAWENPYMAIMQKSSINQKEVESWEKKYYHPILNAIYKIFDAAEKRDVGVLRGIFGTDSMDDILNNYLQGKHGLERNRDMAVRNALDEMTKATLITKKEAEEMLEQVNTELQNDIITPTEADARRQQIGNMLSTKKFTKEQVQAQTEVWKERKDAIRKDDTLSWAEKQRALDKIATTEFSVDLAAKDYSGLGEVFPNEDGKLEQSIEDAYTAVEAFEELFDTKDLWDAIKAANNATIEKSFRSGIINKATMDSIRDMYDYYIPLRGFEAATTEDVYGYLNNEPRAFSMPVKRANGRASKAEFAIPHILQMAHSAILQGNNNLVKMKMANFAQHYPTDLIKQINMYIEYDEVNDVWKAKYAEIPENATPEEVDALIAEHNEKMAKAVKENPNKYRKVSGKMDVPYIIPKGMDSYHQIPYKRNGVDCVLTVNGDPRLAFVMNGELEKAATTFAGKAGEAVEGFTRFLAGMYTQYNPEFMLSNAFRDGTWVLATVPVRENAKYTAKFYKNYFKLIVPGVMQNLFVRYEKGTLDMSNDTHREFANFIKNGGETGYAILKDVENTKKRVSKDIHPSLWSKVMKLIDKLGIVARGVESSARFAAYLASREEGRSITRSAYDAKEVSVNFNRKGAGAAFNDLHTQTLIGQIAGAAAEWFIINNAFFNAGMQGLAGVCRLCYYNPFKATTAFSSAFLLGMVVASLFDDDDDYYNLSETVRRQNIIFRAGGDYVSIPLAIELRAMYGLGEMAVSYARGKEDFTGGKNLSHKIAEQVMQALPINVLEGNGGFDAIYPTLYAIINDVKVNEDWQGMPIYREDKYPTDEFNPEWQMVYSYTGRGYIAASKFWSELWGGDEGKRGELNILGYNVAEINPAKVQHIAEGILGGPLSFFDKIVATIDIARGKKDFEWRNIPFASRIMKDGGGKAQERANNREYYNNEKRYDAMHNSEKMYEKIANDPNRSKEDREKYRLLLDELKGSPEYKQLNDFHEASLEIDKMYRDAKKEDALDKAMPDINKEKMKANAILDNK